MNRIGRGVGWMVGLVLLTGWTVRLWAEPAASAPLSVHLDGDVEFAGDWTVERIGKDLAKEVREVTFTVKGRDAKARCVPLAAFVAAAKPRIDPKRKGHDLAFVVRVRGRDGYTASFSFGELAVEVGRRDAWVALDRDGQPLDEVRGPVELVVPGDAKAARWVRGVASVTVLDTTASPAAK